MPVRRAIRVIVVGSNPVLCEGIVSLLDRYDDMRVVAVGAMSDQCRDVETDVAVVGLVGLGLDAATRTIAGVRARPDTKIVAVIDGEADVLTWVVAPQVHACLTFETVDAHALVDAVRAVMGGQTVFSMELLSELRQRERSMAPGWTLTPRERDVLALLAEGHSNKAIADQLALQAGTLRGYVSTILAKLGVANRTEAATVALRQGLLAGATSPAVPQQRDGYHKATERVGVPPS